MNAIIKIILSSLLSLGGLVGTYSVASEKAVTQVTQTQTTNISLQQAKEIALAKVNGTVTKAVLDDDNHYDIEIIKDGYEYDFEISLTGVILEQSKEKVDTTTTNTSTTKITLDQAKKIALAKVNGTIKKAILDDDHYEIEIIKGNYEYDFEISLTGTILEQSKDKLDSDDSSSTTSSKVTLAQAKKTALKRVNGTITKTSTDDDDYTIYIKKGNTLYEIEVDRYTGKITDVDQETIKSSKITLSQAKTLALKKVNGKIVDTKSDSDEYTIFIEKGDYIYEVEVDRETGKIEDVDKERKPSTSSNIISKDKARQIALKRVSGTVRSVEYDSDDKEYSVEIVKNNVEYEITIDAVKGTVLEVEKDD